jgi:hypothetical protein
MSAGIFHRSGAIFNIAVGVASRDDDGADGAITGYAAPRRRERAKQPRTVG